MYVLHADDPVELREKLIAFESYMEPYLRVLEHHKDIHYMARQVPELREYLSVCRWLFRKLEFSFVIQALLAYLKPGDHYLDAGCGATPLPHVIAGQHIATNACDAAEEMIKGLKRLNIRSIFGTKVSYAVADLADLHYASNHFDAISCIAVLEYLPARKEQAAIQQLIRVLKPGGILVITLDFRPSHDNATCNGYAYYRNHLAPLISSGELVEIYCSNCQTHAAISNPLPAALPTIAKHLRTAELSTPRISSALEAQLHGSNLQSDIPFTYLSQGRRVLPLALILQKPLEP